MKIYSDCQQTLVDSVASSDKLAHSATISWVSFFLHCSPRSSKSFEDVTNPGFSLTVASIGYKLQEMAYEIYNVHVLIYYTTQLFQIVPMIKQCDTGTTLYMYKKLVAYFTHKVSS